MHSWADPINSPYLVKWALSLCSPKCLVVQATIIEDLFKQQQAIMVVKQVYCRSGI